MSYRETTYQTQLIARIKERFPGCIVMKNDSGYLQGIPDLTVLYKDRWAVLEVKAYADAPVQPNQDWYITELYHMSYAAYVYPENEEEVLHDLQRALRPRRSARLSQR